MLKLILLSFLSITLLESCDFTIRPVNDDSTLKIDTHSADGLYGASDYSHNLNSEYGLYIPRTPLYAGGKLFLIDQSQYRILVWNTPPTTGNQKPDFIIGQPTADLNMTNGSLTALAQDGNLNLPNAWSFGAPNGMCFDGTHLIVADRANNRVLIWNSLPTLPGTPANVVLGQPDFVSNTVNNGGISPKSLNQPWDVHCSSGKLYVVDRSNHRILFWNTIPSTNFTPADGVLGQANFTTGTASVSASKLSNPTQVNIISGKLFVSDYGNNRIAIWNTTTPTSSQAIDSVLGQPSLTVNTVNNGGISGHSLNAPSDINAIGSAIYISDYSNHRILVWDSLPASASVNADRVIGQPLLTSNSQNNGGISAHSLYSPLGVASDGTHLYIADSNNNRMLIFNSIPSTSTPSADAAWGQPNLALNTDRAGANPVTSLNRPFTLDYSGGYTWSADSRYQRVLRWPLGKTPFDGVPPDLVLGQTTLTSTAPAAASTSLNTPTAAFSNGTVTYVADCNNSRVLVWPTMPTVNGTAASAVLGQSLFTVGTTNTGGISPHSMACPYDVTIDSGKLFVADYSNNRVLIWNSLPTSSTVDADVVLGQTLFTTNAANNGGLSASSMGFPACVRVYDGKLFVCDRKNHRIMVWNSIPSSNGTPASYVIGQNDFTSGAPDAGGTKPSAHGLNQPLSIAYRGKKFFVSEFGNHRVLIWNSLPVVSGVAADDVLGEPDFQSVVPNVLGLSSKNLFAPLGLELFNSDLWISDYGNNRLLRFSGQDH